MIQREKEEEEEEVMAIDISTLESRYISFILDHQFFNLSSFFFPWFFFFLNFWQEKCFDFVNFF